MEKIVNSSHQNLVYNFNIHNFSFIVILTLVYELFHRHQITQLFKPSPKPEMSQLANATIYAYK